MLDAGYGIRDTGYEIGVTNNEQRKPMKKANHFILSDALLLAVFLVLLTSLTTVSNIKAQNPFSPYNMLRARSQVNDIVVFSYKPCLKVRFLILKAGRKVGFRSDRDTLAHISRVTRLKQDSVFLDGTGYWLGELTVVDFAPGFAPPGPSQYSRTEAQYARQCYHRDDTASWDVFYPEKSIYSPGGPGLYIRQLKYQVKREKQIVADPMIFGNFIKFNLAKLLHLEIAASYEIRIAPRVTWETEAGYLFGVSHHDGPFPVSYPLYSYSGPELLTGPKFFCFRPTYYVGPAFMYKYLWFTDVRTTFPGSGEGGSLQDQFRHDLGISVRFGKMIRSGNFVMDLYFGLGIKTSWIYQREYGFYYYADSEAFKWYNDDQSPKCEHTMVTSPIVNVGIKIGGGF
jgi:hypothetical protein